MTKYTLGLNGGLVGVTAPLTSTMTAQDVRRADALGGSAKASAVVGPMVDAMAYTPGAALTSANDVDEGHHILPAEDESGMGNVAAMSAQKNWSAGRLNPFAKLWDMMSPMRDWLADLVAPRSVESALVLAGVQANDLSVPVLSMMALTEETSGQPNVTSSEPSKGPGSSQGDVKKNAPPPAKEYEEVPRWKIVLVKTGGRR